MPRRGQCRCGLVLTFHRTPQGYKMRCPSCGAVVRLRVPSKRRRRRPDATAAQRPEPDEIDVELLPAMPPGEPRSAPVRRAWLLLALGVGVAFVAVAAGAVWWFLH